MREWLLKLREQGVKLFLLTNSLPDYTKLLCDYALGQVCAFLMCAVCVVSWVEQGAVGAIVCG